MQRAHKCLTFIWIILKLLLKKIVYTKDMGLPDDAGR